MMKILDAQWFPAYEHERLEKWGNPFKVGRDGTRDEVIPYAAMSETSSNCWKLSVINEASCWEYLVDKPSRTSWMAA